jgi:hypothetical protein
MEHLPPVQTPYQPLRAQYLGGSWPPTPCLALSDFLQNENRHLNIEFIKSGTFDPLLRGEIARLLQSWFYFGMLQEMLQLPLQMSDFITTPDQEGKTFITTGKLRDYLATWKSQIELEKSTPAVLERRNARFITCARYTYNAWKSLGDTFANILGEDIELSIHLLATSLEHAANSIADIDIDYLPWRSTRNPIVTRRLLEMGWCPTVVEQTEFSCKVALPYFLSLLGPVRDARHVLDFEGKEGGPGCEVGDEGCKTKQVNNETFVTKHFEGCDGKCGFLEADKEKVRRVVEGGGIPIARLNTDGEKPVIEITELKGFMQYTAFSHV